MLLIYMKGATCAYVLFLCVCVSVSVFRINFVFPIVEHLFDGQVCNRADEKCVGSSPQSHNGVSRCIPHLPFFSPSPTLLPHPPFVSSPATPPTDIQPVVEYSVVAQCGASSCPSHGNVFRILRSFNANEPSSKVPVRESE